MQRNARATVLTAATLMAAGCARSDFAVSRNDRTYWQTVKNKKVARAVQAPPPKILPETYFAAARLHETRGQFSQAITQYRKAVAVNHNFVEAYHRLGVLLGAMGQFPEANDALYKAVQLSPKDAVLRNNLGFQLLMQENWHGARREFTRAIELSPGFARAHINLGLVLSKLGHFDDALEQFLAALPAPDAYYNLGLMYRSQKRYAEAADAFRTTLEHNPDFAAAGRQLEQLAAYLKPPKPVELSEPVQVAVVQTAPEEVETQSSHAVPDVEVTEPAAGDWDEPDSSTWRVASEDASSSDELPFYVIGSEDFSARESQTTPFERPVSEEPLDDSPRPDQAEEFFSEDTPWSDWYVEETVPPCEGQVVGEIRVQEQNKSAELGSVNENAGPRSLDQIVNTTPSAPLYELSDPLASAAAVGAVRLPDAKGGVEVKANARRVAPVRTAPRTNAVRKPVVRSEKPVKILPVKTFRLAKKSRARAETKRRSDRVIESFADERPLPVTWNDVTGQQTSCVDSDAMLRELDAHLELVRAEINCLDEALIDDAYRMASLEKKETVRQSATPTAPAVEQPRNSVELPVLESTLNDPVEAVIGPVQAEAEPFLVREEWQEPEEQPEEEPAKKEPAARLDLKRNAPDHALDEAPTLFDGLLDLCSIIENESRCLAELESDDGPVMSFAFDPTVDPVLPPFMPFDLLLEVVWDTTPVEQGEQRVCIADPLWCVDQNVPTRDVVSDQVASDRLSNNERRHHASWP